MGKVKSHVPNRIGVTLGPLGVSCWPCWKPLLGFNTLCLTPCTLHLARRTLHIAPCTLRVARHYRTAQHTKTHQPTITAHSAPQHARKRAHTYTHMRKHAHAHTYTHKNSHTHIHTRTQEHSATSHRNAAQHPTRTHTRIHIHTCRVTKNKENGALDEEEVQQ